MLIKNPFLPNLYPALEPRSRLRKAVWPAMLRIGNTWAIRSTMPTEEVSTNTTLLSYHECHRVIKNTKPFSTLINAKLGEVSPKYPARIIHLHRKRQIS